MTKVPSLDYHRVVQDEFALMIGVTVAPIRIMSKNESL